MHYLCSLSFILIFVMWDYVFVLNARRWRGVMRSVQFACWRWIANRHFCSIISFVEKSFLKWFDLSRWFEELERLRLKSTKTHMKRWVKIKRQAFQVLLLKRVTWQNLGDPSLIQSHNLTITICISAFRHSRWLKLKCSIQRLRPNLRCLRCSLTL